MSHMGQDLYVSPRTYILVKVGMRWEWKLRLIQEAAANYDVWLVDVDDPLDQIRHFASTIHHMACKARYIPRAMR